MKRKIMILLLFFIQPVWAQTGDLPWWWDEAWWSEGRYPEVKNHPVETRELSYRSGDVNVPVFLVRPKGRGHHPGVLFVHGRRGLDEVNRLHAVRLAARGFIVYAPDLYIGRFIPQFPIEHDYVLEDDLDKALDAFLGLPEMRGKKVCTVGISRGGYYTLKLAVTKQRQKKDVACYVGYYPHLQDPNAPEPAQVYRYAPEVDALDIPVMVFVGEHEQYQRRRNIAMAIEALQAKGRAALLVEYPGVGRAFDFRHGEARSFADDLAAKDAMLRAADFMHRHLR